MSDFSTSNASALQSLGNTMPNTQEVPRDTQKVFSQDKNTFDELLNTKDRDASALMQNTGVGQMSNPLDSLFSNRMPAPTAQTAPATMAAADDALAQNLVDRILVANPEKGGTEIRIMLNDSALKGTEIQLTRGNDGLLTVNLQTNDASSFQTLVDAQDTLKQRLEMQGETVKVEVSSTEESEQAGQDGNDANKRSQGFMEQEDLTE